MENKNMMKCKACGKDIAKGVNKCVHCGKDQRSFFKKHKIVTGILVLLLIGIIGSALGGDKTQPSKQAATSNSDSTKVITPVEQVVPVEEAVLAEEVIIVSAVDLAKEYEDNEVRADKNYKGKMVEINGTVKSIGVLFEQTYIVLSSGKDFSLTDIQCMFKDEAEIDKIADLDEGDVVTVLGRVDGKSMNVSVVNCIFK